MNRRTKIDFSQHQLLITERDGLLVHHLRKPNTVMDSIKFINTNGILAVNGDYSNWIFCREFVPTANGRADSHYWKEKLKIGSCQEPSKYDSERTEERIREMLADTENNYNDEDKEYFNQLLKRVDDELEYTYYAYREYPSRWDSESVPFVKSVDYHFLAILDGFDEICRRMKEVPEKIIYKESDIEKAKSYLNDQYVDPDGTGIMHGERMKEVMKIMGVEFTGTEKGWQLINKQ